MSGENLAKFYLGALDRVRDRALGMLGSRSPRSLAHHAYAWSHHVIQKNPTKKSATPSVWPFPSLDTAPQYAVPPRQAQSVEAGEYRSRNASDPYCATGCPPHALALRARWACTTGSSAEYASVGELCETHSCRAAGGGRRRFGPPTVRLLSQKGLTEEK